MSASGLPSGDPTPVVVAGAERVASASAPGTEGDRTPETAQGEPDLIRELARVLDPVAYDPRAEPRTVGQYWDRKTRQMVAEVHATAALAAGYRRVVEDEDTVERVARALAFEDERRWYSAFQALPRTEAEARWPLASRRHYSARARAAVRALREGSGR